MIPLFPLNTTLFPGGVLTLRIFEVRYLDMIRKCIAQGEQFGVVALVSGREVRTPEGVEVLADYGTMARIDESSSPMPGLMHIRCTGTSRFALGEREIGEYGAWRGEATAIEDDAPSAIPAPLQKIADRLGELIVALQKERVAPDEMPIGRPYRLHDSGWVANRWSELLPLAVEQKQRLLAMQDPVERLRTVQPFLDSLT